MKRFLLGCVLMLLGVIGGTGWLIALVIIHSGYPSVLTVLQECKEVYVVIAFYVVALLGLYFAIDDLNKK